MSELAQTLTGRRIRALREALLAFFDGHRRPLPWRSDGDPYRVWISEIMAQQTRVETVVPYYERWIERFPTLESLANADIDDVLHAWQGLGYYSRARNLHRAALLVRERYGGHVPSDPSELRALPGIGAYTAGAIASIAFGVPAAAVDGNVRRVLHRLLDEGDIPMSALQAVAARLVPPQRAGDFNQAMMELGATVCTPRLPACGACPVSELCDARRNGTQAIRPAARARAGAVPAFDLGTAVIRIGTRFLVVRRPDSGLLAGMWEFPGAVTRPSESPLSAARRASRMAGVRTGRTPGRFMAALPHAFSHRRETYHAWRFDIGSAGRLALGAEWASASDLDGLAMPAAQRRLADLAVASLRDR